MIVLMGFPEDSVIQSYAGYLHQQGLTKGVYLIDLHQIGANVFIDSEGFYDASGRLAHRDISAVYNRFFRHPEQKLSGDLEEQFRRLHYCLDYEYPVVVNRPLAGLHNFSKLWQICALADCGLNTIPSEVFVNLGHWRENHIIKSISAHRSVCKHYHGGKVCEPVLIQPNYGQHNIRVHCIGNKVFSQSIVTEDLDYRYSRHNHWQYVNLPDDIEQAISSLTVRLGLDFIGVDLLLHEGKYYVLEVNPSPGYAFFESQMSEPLISQALTQHLGVDRRQL